MFFWQFVDPGASPARSIRCRSCVFETISETGDSCLLMSLHEPPTSNASSAIAVSAILFMFCIPPLLRRPHNARCNEDQQFLSGQIDVVGLEQTSEDRDFVEEGKTALVVDVRRLINAADDRRPTVSDHQARSGLIG